MQASPVIVVLAAGRGSRFDGAGHKLAQPLGDASVLGTTLRAAAASGLPMVVVTVEGLQREAERFVAARDIVLIGAAEAQRAGMSRSIVSGVSARSNATGWLIHPADMPLVRPQTFRALAAALPGQACVVAHFGGRRGHPVGFSAELYSELLRLDGDEGARRLLLRYPSRVLDVDDAGILVDIDTQADLDAARARLETSGTLS
jgi:molybdenum cofactor cytidylyltransferase